MMKELQITIGYNDDEKDGGYYSLKAKGHKTRYCYDGLTLVQIMSGWIKQGLHYDELTKDDWKKLGGDEGKAEEEREEIQIKRVKS